MPIYSQYDEIIRGWDFFNQRIYIKWKMHIGDRLINVMIFASYIVYRVYQ